jgi:hypothetical protein
MLSAAAHDVNVAAERTVVFDPAPADVAVRTDVHAFADFGIGLGKDGAEKNRTVAIAPGHGEAVKASPEITPAFTGEKAQKLGQGPERGVFSADGAHNDVEGVQRQRQQQKKKIYNLLCQEFHSLSYMLKLYGFFCSFSLLRKENEAPLRARTTHKIA